MFYIFCTGIRNTDKPMLVAHMSITMRKRAVRFASKLKGYIGVEPNWQDDSYGLMFYFTTEILAGAAAFDLETSGVISGYKIDSRGKVA